MEIKMASATNQITKMQLGTESSAGLAVKAPHARSIRVGVSAAQTVEAP